MPATDNIGTHTESLIAQCYKSFESGDFNNSKALLERAHHIDFEDHEISSAMKVCGFWMQRLKILDYIANSGERGDYLRKQWRVFSESYMEKLGHNFAIGRECIKKWIHRTALGYYLELISETGGTDALIQVGRCHKALGHYQESIKVFDQAIRQSEDKDSLILAELADAYALIGEVTSAKVLMREALFIAPARIKLYEIDSSLFKKFIARMESELKNHHNNNLREWLAVYGVIWGVLNVKRELSNGEFIKLRQQIYSLSNKRLEGQKDASIVPRLINHYFWLIGYYESTDSDDLKINEALMKINMLSPTIYRLYLK